MKRLLTIQDISCVGKCSLTVALPVLSVMGVEACVLPTAVLSSHTMFTHVNVHDLTEDILPILRCWQQEGIVFDGIYTGYLASKKQVALVRTLIRELRRPGCPVIIDPAMADNGALYRGFESDFIPEMAGLCAEADIVLPNATEAALLTGLPERRDSKKEYPDRKEAEALLRALTALGPGYAAITGVSTEPGKIGCMGYDSKTDRYFHYENTRLDRAYHGTGDIFAGTAAGALMRGMHLEEALSLAVDFTLETMKCTKNDRERRSYGVSFELALPWLVKRMRSANTDSFGAESTDDVCEE